MNVLDEKGYVFVDDNSEPWIFYWHPDKRWVSLRRISGPDVMAFGQNKLSDEHAEIYHELNEREFI